MGGHPNAYDRFWFNAYREDLFVGVALGPVPQPRRDRRGGRASCRAACSAPSSRRGRSGPRDAVGPISIEIVDRCASATVRVDAPDQGVAASSPFTARTRAIEEPRQTRHDGPRLVMDVTRATQLGTWAGALELDGERVDLGAARTYGTKDRSWGVRPVGEPVAAAPRGSPPALLPVGAASTSPTGALHLSRVRGRPRRPVDPRPPRRSTCSRDGDEPGGRRTACTTSAATGPTSSSRQGLRRRGRRDAALTDADGATSSVELEPLAHVPHARRGLLPPDLRARPLPRRARRRRRGATTSPSSTRRRSTTCTSSRWCAPRGAIAPASACSSSSRSARTPRAGSPGSLDGAPDHTATRRRQAGHLGTVGRCRRTSPTGRSCSPTS